MEGRRGAGAPQWLAAAITASLLAAGAVLVAGAGDLQPARPGPPPTAVDQPVETSTPGTPRLLRLFTPGSWWTSPVPPDAPTHPGEAHVLKYMSTARESNGGCVRLAGARNSWGQPVYWASPGDPEYDVRVPKVDEPPELDSLRVPVGAVAARTSDDAMTVFDLERGYVAALTGAKFLEEEGTWRASGATVTYLDSNGLHVDTGRADDPRNDGSHRGNNGATMMVRYDQYLAGRIDNVLKVASGPELSTRAVFPMVNSDGDSEDPEAPPQGLRLRVRPDVDLDSLDLHPEARVIAEALQRYGMYLGDSGGATALKLEDTAAEGGDQTWTVPSDGLCALPLTEEFWDVLPEGYHPGTANGSP